MIEHQEQIDKFISEITPYLGGLAAVPDDWINQVKLHVNPKFPDEYTAALYVVAMLMFEDLFISRIADFVDNGTKEYIEGEMIEAMSKTYVLLQTAKFGQKKEEIKHASFFLDMLEKFRKGKAKEQLTFIEAWTELTVGALKGTLPKEVVRPYIASKVELFEEENYRQRFQKILEKSEI